MILYDQDFANEVINQFDKSIQITKIFELKDNARNILTAERTMLNFIQMLSATATAANKLVKLISQYKTKLLDTCNTIPGFCLAQKYAVRYGDWF